MMPRYFLDAGIASGRLNPGAALADTERSTLTGKPKTTRTTQIMGIAAATEIDFEKGGGVVPVVAQDYASGRVLKLAYMNREALAETIRTGRACYYSRSRASLWRKGEESGNYQSVREIRVDCDAD